MRDWWDKISAIKTTNEFNLLALEAFHFQFNYINDYRTYCESINKIPGKVEHYTNIPFLPIEFFKTHEIFDKSRQVNTVFSSSGTTGQITSKHFVADPDLYEKSFTETFKLFYGNIENYVVLALLPSYLERGGSSLVYMAEKLIKLSKHTDSGFYLNNYDDLIHKIQKLSTENRKILLIGVTYALLDVAELYSFHGKKLIIMETGGMKGRRKELIREELHQILCEKLGVNTIHSEYGMTELLSQAYSKGKGIFNTPPWMKILIRDTYDPFSYLDANRGGGINVIDLANINSCCFIETKDIGKVMSPDSFTILGRFDHSDIRGCNLMVE